MRPTEPMIVPRRPLAIVAAVLAVLLSAVSIFFMVKAYGTNVGVNATDGAMPLDPVSGELVPSFKPPVVNQTEYVLAGVGSLVAVLVSGGFALVKLLSSKESDPQKQQANDRLHVLIFGGILGGILVLLGFALCYCWFSELTGWLNKDEKAKVWKPLTAILIFLVGAAGMFLAAQPARCDERNNSGVRRAVYGVNLALSAVLVFALLLVVNIVVGMKLPARLDTTESGIYSITPKTQEYLQQLNQDITIYNTMPETGRLGDVARLLGSIREANPQRIRIRPLTQDIDKAEIDSLKAKYKSTELIDPADGSVRMGLLVAAGSGDKATFINADELFGRTPGQRGATGRMQFQGESRILREVLFLTENKTKAVIYFTQGAGEIGIVSNAGGEIGIPRVGEQLKTQLAADGTEVRPLAIDPTSPNPKVPDDASIVIVADPRTTLSETSVAALRKYMQTKKPDGSFGKLIVMAGARAQPGSKSGILKTGLEELLDEFGIAMPGRILYATPTNQLPPDAVIAEINSNLVKSRNTIALTYMDTGFAVSATRPVIPKRQANGPLKVEPLLLSLGDRASWYEESIAANPRQSFIDLRTAAEKGDNNYLMLRNFEPNGPRLLAAIASETSDDGKTTNRLAVFGFGTFFEDRPQNKNFPAEFLAATVNWLRDRPAVANDANKTYGVYEPNKKMSWNQVFLLPVGVTIIGLATLGLGLWAWRRK